jgi:hypothetical protein
MYHIFFKLQNSFHFLVLFSSLPRKKSWMKIPNHANQDISLFSMNLIAKETIKFITQLFWKWREGLLSLTLRHGHKLELSCANWPCWPRLLPFRILSVNIKGFELKSIWLQILCMMLGKLFCLFTTQSLFWKLFYEHLLDVEGVRHW